MTNQLEWETVKARVLILCQYFPEHVDSLNKALQYGVEDPSASLFKVRQVLEEASKEIWDHHDTEPMPSLFEVFNHKKIREAIPKRVLNRIHGLRALCNLGVHGDPVTSEDVLTSLNHLFVVLDWHGKTHKNLPELPIPVQPPHSFIQYIKEGIQDKLFLFIVLANTLASGAIFRYHDLFPKEFDRPFDKVYEGMFVNGLGFLPGVIISLTYALVLTFITSALSWMIFKRFRNQNFESRLLSFELMFILIFSAQYLLLTILDYFTRIF